eukprot:scaffold18687_cov118-Isochrysis_galbana.AAC.2
MTIKEPRHKIPAAPQRPALTDNTPYPRSPRRPAPPPARPKSLELGTTTNNNNVKGEEHATHMRKSGESCGENGRGNESKVVESVLFYPSLTCVGECHLHDD